MTGDLEALTDPVRDCAIKATEETPRLHDTSARVCPRELVHRRDLGDNQFRRILLAGLSDRRLGHRPGHERMGCLAPS